MSEMLAGSPEWRCAKMKQISCGSIRPAQLSTSPSSQRRWERMQISRENLQTGSSVTSSADAGRRAQTHMETQTKSVCRSKNMSNHTGSKQKCIWKLWHTEKEKAAFNRLQINTLHSSYCTQIKSNLLYSYNQRLDVMYTELPINHPSGILK